MPEPTQNLDDWLKRVQGARSHQDVFQILDKFRTHEWTDEQCAAMAHTYLRVLQSTTDTGKDQEPTAGKQKSKDTAKIQDSARPAQPEGEQEASAAQAPVNDGPVWYEKM